MIDPKPQTPDSSKSALKEEENAQTGGKIFGKDLEGDLGL